MIKRVLALTLAMVFVLAGCSSKTDEIKAIDTSAVGESIQSQVEMKDGMKLVEHERAAENAYPGITDLAKEYTIYINSTGGYAEEIAVITAKDDVDVSKINDMVDERIEYQKLTFENYQPREMAKLADPVIVTQGKTVILVVADDAKAAKEIVETSLQ